MIRYLEAIAIGLAVGAVIDIVGGYWLLGHAPETVLDVAFGD